MAPKNGPVGEDAALKQADESSIVASPEGAAESIGALLRLAVESKLDVDALAKLVGLQERILDREASQEFNRALADFQRECPAIAKTSTAQIATRSGSNYSYSYADLREITKVAGPLLAARGLSYSWDMEMTETGQLRCTCSLRHVNGHREAAHFTSPVESKAGMSEQQKHAAALTYARRQSLVSVLGLSTCDPDDDGAGHGPAGDEPITAVQLDTLRGLLAETNADEDRFLAYFKAAYVDLLPQRDFARAKAMLESKRKAAR